jgi:hypothetical protein
MKADSACMKALASLALSVGAWFLFLSEAPAQYKAPSQYFPKNRPVPGAPGGQPSAPRQTPAAPQQSKFKDVAVNSQFYFLADTNRAFAWIKTSDTTAKNTKNGVAQAINGETPIQR